MGEGLPQYIKDHPVYYAGPAKTPKGMPSGSFGPTTAARMDPYVDLFQDNGGSMIMIAKGNRSQAVTDACRNKKDCDKQECPKFFSRTEFHSCLMCLMQKYVFLHLKRIISKFVC